MAHSRERWNSPTRQTAPPLLGHGGFDEGFGVHEFAARLPNALAVTAWVAITFLFGAHWAGKKRGSWRG